MPGIGYLTRVIRGVSFEKMNKTLDVVKEKSGHGKARTFVDMLWCTARYGAGYYDYTMFGFYDMNGRQRDTYLTRVRNKKVQEMMNDDTYSDLFDDKLRFDPLFEKFLHRKYLDAGKATAEEMEDFLKDQEFFFAKPNHGTCGDGIEKLKTASFKDAAAALDYVRSKDLPVLEHALAQHPDMARLHPQSVNTIRIVTDRVGSEVYIAYMVVKIGRGDGFCDNSGQGGVICRVDPESGKIISVATDDYFNVFEKHPDTGITFKGYQLPMHKEAIEFAKEAAMVVPQIRHVGWDIAITPDGPALIEGNDYPGTDLCQLAPHFPEKQGLWPFYKKILDLQQGGSEMDQELHANQGKNEIIEVDGVSYRRLPIVTHLITDKDDICDVAEKYGKPMLKEKGDILFISEKAVACTQHRAIPLEDIKPRKLAVMLSDHVTKTPHGIGLGMPESMEMALREVGTPRILFASAVSVIGKKIFKRKGWFYNVAGYRARSIDGPTPNTIPPYNHCVVLGPLHPDKVAKQIKDRIGFDTIIVDINDLEGQILGASSKKISKALYAKVLKDNPLGQDCEQTPMGVIRKVK